MFSSDTPAAKIIGNQWTLMLIPKLSRCNHRTESQNNFAFESLVSHLVGGQSHHPQMTFDCKIPEEKKPLTNSFFTLHETGTRGGTGNRTGILKTMGPRPCPCLWSLWTFLHDILEPIDPVSGPVPFMCSVNISPNYHNYQLSKVSHDGKWITGRERLIRTRLIRSST